jgi:hypothetical protein
LLQLTNYDYLKLSVAPVLIWGCWNSKIQTQTLNINCQPKCFYYHCRDSRWVVNF